MANQGQFVGPCCRCRTEMWLPSSLYESAKRSEKITFYCPFGHPQIFTEGESEEQKLRRERDWLKQQMAQRDDEIARQTRLADELRRQVATHKTLHVNTRKRAAAGVCLCCHRTFKHVALHMRNMHPEFIATEVH